LPLAHFSFLKLSQVSIAAVFGLPSIQSRIHKKLDRNWKDAMNRNPKNKFEVPGDIDHGSV